MVTNPCDPNPCKSGFLCSINHLCRHGDLACSHYICQPGCSVGDGPSLLYPRGSRIRVPVELLSTEDGELHLGYSTCNTVYMLCTCFQGSHVFRCILSLFTLYLLSNVFLFPCTYTSSLLLNEPCSFSSFYPSSLHTSVGSRHHICLYMSDCFGFFNCTTPLPGESEVENVPGTSPPPPTIHCEQQLHCPRGHDDVYRK